MLWPNGSEVEPRLSTPESEADFGPRVTGKGFHDGVDYANYFQLIRAIAAGRVVRVEEWDGKPWYSTRTQHGNRVWIDHGDGVVSSYSHLGRIDVQVGQVVAAGQALGTMGATGYAFGVHLHFEVRVNGNLIDPRPFVRARIGGSAAGSESEPFEPVEDDMYDEKAEERLLAEIDKRLDEVKRVAAPYRVFAWGTGHLCVNPLNGRFWILPQGYGELLSHLGYRGGDVKTLDDAQLGFVTGFFPSAVGEFAPTSGDGFTDADLEAVKAAVAENRVAITEEQMEILVAAVGESFRTQIEGVTFVVKTQGS